MIAITPDHLKHVMPLAGANSGVFAPLLTAAAERFEINTPRRVCAWLAQIAEETRELNAFVESFNYKDPARLLALFKHDFKDLADAVAVHARGQQAIANRVYANQNGNGPEASGDGWKFRGRGGAMTTGKENYLGVALALDLDLMEHPELLEHPEHAANAAGFTFKAFKLGPLADAGDIGMVNIRWNGGKNGYDRRCQYYSRALDAYTLKGAQ